MEAWLVVLAIVVALGASMLTLFSGFGLGTLLLPAFALVFELDVAVAATAIVHLANNLWKGTLFRNDPDWPVVLRFGLPALLAAFVGAWLLTWLAGDGVLLDWAYGQVTLLGLVMGGLIIVFGLVDLVPALKRWNVDEHWLVPGGLLSGFFGGLSGHQGALRSVFLTKLGLDPVRFVATGTMIAVSVDVARLAVYGGSQAGALRHLGGADWALVAGAVFAAFLGAVVGKRMLGKTTMEGVRTLVGALLLLVGGLLAAGIV